MVRNLGVRVQTGTLGLEELPLGARGFPATTPRDHHHLSSRRSRAVENNQQVVTILVLVDDMSFKHSWMPAQPCCLELI